MNKKILAIIGVAVAGIALALVQVPVQQEPASKLGLVVNTPDHSTSLQDLSRIYSEAADTGIGRSNVYLFWDAVEPARGQFSWDRPDILMSFNKNNDFKVTLYFSIINGQMLGPFPDWIGKPSLSAINEDHLVNVLDAVLSRYDIIDTLIIAGETESHFRYSEHDIPVYRELFASVYDELKERHPDVKIGNSFALHHVINKNLDHIVEELAAGDFVGFSYFPVDSLNDIVKTPSEAAGDLADSLVLVPGMKTAFMEVGWSTSDFVGGSSQAQAAFVQEVFGFYSENEQEIEFLTWYRQYDRPADTCTVEQPTGGSLGLAGNEHVVERLGHYICSSGLISSDGTPKPGWDEFRAQLGAG